MRLDSFILATFLIFESLAHATQGTLVHYLPCPHIMIPESNAISSVNTNTGHPDRTELNTVFAELPGGSSTTMNATPGDPTRGMNLWVV